MNEFRALYVGRKILWNSGCSFPVIFNWKALKTLFLNFASCLIQHNTVKRTTLFNPGVGHWLMQSFETKHRAFPQTHINTECSSNGN
jgi:hypothetical protein